MDLYSKEARYERMQTYRNMEIRHKAACDAFAAFMLRLHKWPLSYGKEQFILYLNGVRGVDLSDATCVHVDDFLKLVK